MLHSAIHWPEVSDPSIWPMAVQYATYLYNKVPDSNTRVNGRVVRVRWYLWLQLHFYMGYRKLGILIWSIFS